MSLEFSPVVREVRKARMAISAKFGHDLKKVAEHYMRMQEQPEFKSRLVKTAPRKKAKSS